MINCLKRPRAIFAAVRKQGLRTVVADDQKHSRMIIKKAAGSSRILTPVTQCF